MGPAVTRDFPRDLETPNRAFLEVNSRPIGQQIVIDPRLAAVSWAGFTTGSADGHKQEL